MAKLPVIRSIPVKEQPQRPPVPGKGNRVTVTILGETYTIRGEAEPGYIQEVTSLVENRMQSLRNASGDLSRLKLAVLTAVNLADELLQERMKKKEADNPDSVALAQKASQLISLLDEGLIGDILDEDSVLR